MFAAVLNCNSASSKRKEWNIASPLSMWAWAFLQQETGKGMLPTVAPEAVWVWVPSAALAVIATIRKATRKIFLGNTGMCRIKQSRSAAIPEV